MTSEYLTNIVYDPTLLLTSVDVALNKAKAELSPVLEEYERVTAINERELMETRDLFNHLEDLLVVEMKVCLDDFVKENTPKRVANKWYQFKKKEEDIHRPYITLLTLTNFEKGIIGRCLEDCTLKVTHEREVLTSWRNYSLHLVDYTPESPERLYYTGREGCCLVDGDFFELPYNKIYTDPRKEELEEHISDLSHLRSKITGNEITVTVSEEINKIIKSYI